MTARRVGIVQARMGSHRLPGKVLADIDGRPMLERVLTRLSRARRLDAVGVATTTLSDDDPVAALCRDLGIPCVRGSVDDVLDRFHQAAGEWRADSIVRVTGDCPLIDPALVDEVVSAFERASPAVAFACNRLPWDRTYPIGLDTEICSRSALETAWREADQPHQREHVMPFLYENPDRFRLLHVQSGDRTLGSLRWTVDETEDLAFVRQVYARMGRDDFSWRDVLDLLAREPELGRVNLGVVHKSHRDVG